jgi:glycosyltransferase involved in cell wall biosynthesis
MVVPQARLSIVGRRPPEEILAYRSPDVLVTGAVDDVRPYLESAAVVVVPLRLGSGTRLKILEAMAMGKAVVSTTLGAEGIDVVAGQNILLADDPATFASQIRRLLENPSLAARIGAAGRRLVEERYSWRSSVERLSTFYGEVLDARAAS